MRTYFYIAVPVLILIAGISFASYERKENPSINVTGLWADSNSTAFQNCYAIFSQDGNEVIFAHYLEFNGTGMVEHGKGLIKDRQVEYDVTVTKNIPGWALAGKHILTLSTDGQTLRGVYKDGKGKTGPLVFKKVH